VLVLARDDDDDGEVRVDALVDAVADPQLTVLGLTVETTPNTQFEADDDAPITAETFFGSVAVGDLVAVQGQWDGTAITAEEVSLGDD
ncbi:MAG: DUF5666 domain-containing protein, partial [Pseudomonadota bacterium]